MATPDDPRDPPGSGPPGSGPEEPRGEERRSAEQRIEDQAREKLSPYLRILRRMVRSIRSVFQAHLIVFRTEADRELARIATGVGLVFGTAIFLLASALLSGAGAVALAQRLTGLPWLESIGIALAGTMLVAAGLAGLAWLRLRKPLMPESRKLLRDTIDGFTRG